MLALGRLDFYTEVMFVLLACLYVYSDIWLSMLDLVSSTVLCHMQLGECNTSCSIQPHISYSVGVGCLNSKWKTLVLSRLQQRQRSHGILPSQPSTIPTANTWRRRQWIALQLFLKVLVSSVLCPIDFLERFTDQSFINWPITPS